MAEHCERVFVFGLDGAMGRAVRATDTPNIDALLAEGVVSYSARTVMPSGSFPAWTSSSSRVWPSSLRSQNRPSFRLGSICLEGGVANRCVF